MLLAVCLPLTLTWTAVAQPMTVHSFLDDSTLPAWQDVPAPDDDAPLYEPPPEPRYIPDGFYTRISGMSVEPLNDARFQLGGAPIDTELGFGITGAIGYRLIQIPVSFEIEYAYRHYETEEFLDPDTMRLGENQYNLHTITANVLYDVPNAFGPIGVYAGVGAGFRISELRFSTSNGMTDGDISGDGFFWQALGGVTVSVGRGTQFYGGVRYSNAGDVDGDVVQLDTESFSIEAGLRFFF